LDISKVTLLGNSSLGIFGLSTDKFTIVPYGIKIHTLEIIEKTLNTSVIQTTISNSVLIGTLLVGNSNNLLMPFNISDKEIKVLRENLLNDIEIIEIDTKYTALGNLIVMNDKGAIISDIFEKKAQKQISDVLEVETIVGNLLGSPLVGTITMCTNRGILVHPLLSEEEIAEISSILHVRADVCTVNRGIPYPRVGILANSKGAIIGTDCTGPESMRIFEILLAP
jgi:translation initiation factor 6